MDVIITAIICLIVMGCMDRWLHPYEYVRPAGERAAARPRRAGPGRPMRQATRHYSTTQASPFMTSPSLDRASAHR